MLLGTSIKRRILLLTLTAIALTWLAAAALTYQDAKRELGDMLDAHLAQAASLLLTQSAHEIDEIETEHTPLLHPYARHITFQVWEDGRDLRLHSTNAPQTPLGTNIQGYSDKVINGKRWRVFSAWDQSGELLIHVAEQAAVRDALARSIAGNLLEPLWLALPLLAILLWLAVSHGLRPMAQLTRSIEDQQPDHLEPLDIASAPTEVLPLIGRLNRLFGRISKLLENERRFTANAAHELRTPVAAIKAQAQVARGAQTEAEREHALAGAILGCDRATHLIEQLLTLARLESIDTGSMTDCRLHALAREVLAEMAPSALDHGVQLELVQGEEINVNGMPTLLSAMLRNLIDNAVRYTPSGTEVCVDISLDHDMPCIRISDNGPGLSPSELEKVSQPFYRVPGSTASGSGLGLSIVQRIAEIHGAEFRLQANPAGHGLQAIIMFRLP